MKASTKVMFGAGVTGGALLGMAGLGLLVGCGTSAAAIVAFARHANVKSVGQLFAQLKHIRDLPLAKMLLDISNGLGLGVVAAGAGGGIALAVGGVVHVARSFNDRSKERGAEEQDDAACDHYHFFDEYALGNTVLDLSFLIDGVSE